MKYKVDVNCDMGESFGAYKMGQDEQILDYITSANIACGFHAGDPSTMRRTVKLAMEKDVAIGAHPGLQDLVGFGRRNMAISPQEAYDLVVYQIGALAAFVQAEGGNLQHVKPHGALFNMAVSSDSLSEAIAEAVYQVNPELILFGLSGSRMIEAGRKIGLRTANEVFSDRTYQKDGALTPRTEPQALITDPEEAIGRVIRMVKDQKITTLQNTELAITADTLCIHGDGVTALEFAQNIHQSLQNAGIELRKVHEIV
ncbi:LamB/YcsF family protein [Planococcus salinus]|uniref:5-oxoprolinase subunit A n=1 Tax=Planococcus salinus TaxID=1848460 RepID=A0A3M8P7M2_9BACL|nr:5-oxoprolinase subunit PxpA [Planococcus salinus]RNF39689.1 LamB/YcsF family protein [Planococcus salinus]